MTFDVLLEKYRNTAFSERDKGTRFERLMRAYLLTEPKYSAMFKTVCLWEDFFARDELGGIDTGIDLVAETVSGEYWAVQCKFFDENVKIYKAAVDTFISTSGRTFHAENGTATAFSNRLWISTTDKLSENAREALNGQAIPANVIGMNDLRASGVDWELLEKDVHGNEARTERHKLKEHQEKAVETVHEYFKHAERGKLIMACGTGKTFTSLKIAEREAGGFALVLVPSIALVGQLLNEWTGQSENLINAICVCSDPKVSQKKGKNNSNNDDDSSYSTIDLALPATTSPERIIEQYNSFKNEKMTVIFSTYQSIEALSKAQKIGLPDFGLIVCDEAHRTTGVTFLNDEEAAFVRVHDDDFIKAKKRLYMTATPRLYNEESKTKAKKNDAVLCSMDDPLLYGEEIYRIGFGEAVEKGLLTDYKVLIFTVSDKDVPAAFQEVVSKTGSELPADTGAKIVGCINALAKQIYGEGSETLVKADPQPMKRAVAFCQSIKNSKEITELFNAYNAEYDAAENTEKTKTHGVEMKHVDGTFNALKRGELLTWLNAENTHDSCRVLSNVRCLSEGVDVPALDAVMFLSARNSQVDVVQSVGRVMRLAEGKKYGYIIIPVVIPSNVEPDKALDDNERYKVIWSVLNALRAHDDRFNATINKIELNKKRPENVLIGGVPPFSEDESRGTGRDIEYEEKIAEQIRFVENFSELQNVIYARLVQKVGDRRYWEEWAVSVADIAQKQIERITAAVATGKMRADFEKFISDMQLSIDSDILEDRAVRMLAQHSITAPVFDALFENYSFAKSNAVSIAMELMLEKLEQSTAIIEDKKELESFYKSVRERASGIDNAEARQSIIIELYNTFFKTAFPKLTEQLGIVYTPVEVVDFIVHSVSDILKTEFNRNISDENVNVLDPFTGTGTFVARLIQSGLIDKENLKRKYKSEIFANEIVLLAYYIACVNIENAYHDVMENADYTPFEGIALTDTFQSWEELAEDEKAASSLLDENSDRVKRQNKSPITVIFGNPPYSVGQRSANDDNQNKKYERLDGAIERTYAKLSDSTNKNSLYDSYIRAFRYATDRLKDGDGILCYVSNGAWLDGNATAGFRKSLQQEFSKIYVFNLRGNQRTSGELSRKEGGKIFGSGSRTPVAITLLVKRHGFKGSAEIFYADIGDYLKREEKLKILVEKKSFANMELIQLFPNEHGDWITSRSEDFPTFLPLASEKNEHGFFEIKSKGIQTNRDAWVYNFSKDVVVENMKNMVEFYNQQIGKIEPSNNETKISWSRSLRNFHSQKVNIGFENIINTAHYRPFTKYNIYCGEKILDLPSKVKDLFALDNIVICLSSDNQSGVSVLITNTYFDSNFCGYLTAFPLYYYEKEEREINENDEQLNFLGDDENEQVSFGNEHAKRKTEYIRKDGISDFILKTAREKYGNAVKKDDVFYYVYGYLHNKEYREKFADDLKKSLPRIPLADETDEFWRYSKTGRALADLHLNYESVKPLDCVKVVKTRENYTVAKMRFLSKERKDVIIYNADITVENIPAKAYEYVVNGKSAIEWVMERYQVKTDKASGIVNNPNLYAEEIGKPSYILDLLLSVIAVSVGTVEVLEGEV